MYSRCIVNVLVCIVFAMVPWKYGEQFHDERSEDQEKQIEPCRFIQFDRIRYSGHTGERKGGVYRHFGALYFRCYAC